MARIGFRLPLGLEYEVGRGGEIAKRGGLRGQVKKEELTGHETRVLGCKKAKKTPRNYQKYGSSMIIMLKKA